jgi:hypothetical protein
MDAKLVCQTVGVAPSRVHRCSRLSSHNSRTRDATGLRADAARRARTLRLGRKREKMVSEENGDDESLILLDAGPMVDMLLWPILNYWGD